METDIMITRIVAAVLLTITSFVAPKASAQSQAEVGKVFTTKDINEAALVDALTPEPTLRLRSIRVRPSEDATPAKSPAASLLITFQTNSAELTPDSRGALDVVARALAADRLANFAFAVEGHADPRGSSESNRRLSQARADSVVDYLVHEHKIPRDRLSAVGKGETDLANPAVPTAPENRRVTIKTMLP
jgi:outer membrane protein OmpA-like peptidoglycan-associated protein